MKYLLVLLLMLGSSMSSAEGSLIIGGWSEHLFSQIEDLNENHKMVAYKGDKVFVGHLINSFGEDSIVFGRVYQVDKEKLSYGLIFGAASGYEYYHRISVDGVIPIIVPYVTYETGIADPIVAVLANAVVLLIKIDI